MISQKDIINAGTTSINNLILLHLQDLEMSSDEFLLYCNLKMFQEQQVFFPSTQQLITDTGFSEGKIYQLVQSMIQKHFIKIDSQTVKGQKYQDYYDLSPIYQVLLGEQLNSRTSANLNDIQTLFQKIEVEFGRPLSPIEQQTIQAWIVDDHYSVPLIMLALKEAVLNQAYSLKYMDRILLNWEKNNIKTPEQLQNYNKRLEGY
ncbi:DNA replication protein DnaD [Bombilactobacillus mellifer]|uniref:DNA replication protein DnaD n=1 Tax=Bombilactobacillus mellifer TaxID=1218492 RepID=A0A0F4LW54_9LACO|nr:DnaD domain protein [Bombilactobacillus mellifer]KJY61771.1 DNA replication protein DnaD [Bombilactobacillus mellifer]